MISTILLPLVKWLEERNIKTQTFLELPARAFEEVEVEFCESSIYSTASDIGHTKVVFKEILVITKGN